METVSAPEAVITFEHVHKTFGTLSAVEDVSFIVQKGELYGLIGPNGAGKTTSIRLLLGLQKPTSGHITVLGRTPQEASLRPHVGYMPQDTSLYIDLTIYENLLLFGRLYDLPRDLLDQRIGELLDFVDLRSRKHSTISTLSGGMRHRASLAVALLPRPQLLVLDEPTVGVDPELRAAFWQQFDTMRQEGTTIVLTTHYMDEAMRCQRVGLLANGQLLAEDTPQQLITQTHTSDLEAAFLTLARSHRQGAA